MENFSIIFYKIKVKIRMIANYKHIIPLYEINHMQIDINETRYFFCVINFTWEYNKYIMNTVNQVED